MQLGKFKGLGIAPCGLIGSRFSLAIPAFGWNLRACLAGLSLPSSGSDTVVYCGVEPGERRKRSSAYSFCCVGKFSREPKPFFRCYRDSTSRRRSRAKDSLRMNASIQQEWMQQAKWLTLGPMHHGVAGGRQHQWKRVSCWLALPSMGVRHASPMPCPGPPGVDDRSFMMNCARPPRLFGRHDNNCTGKRKTIGTQRTFEQETSSRESLGLHRALVDFLIFIHDGSRAKISICSIIVPIIVYSHLNVRIMYV
jgi:hypothetical protein